MRPLRLAPLLSCLLLASACSVLVAAGDDPVPCIIDGGVDPCPPGLVCQDGFCATRTVGPDAGCVPRDELCGGGDEDCDGMTDEGHDRDMDGFTWCGGGRLELQDCDDNDATVFPGREGEIPPGAEVCDGKDNDCDGTTDEATGGVPICPTGTVCIPGEGCVVESCTVPGFECPPGESCDVSLSPPECVPGVCTPGSCPAGLSCDTATGACVEKRPVGAECLVDAECLSGACTPRDAMRLASAPERLCTQACCTDAECGAGELCWLSGSGARSCLPEAMLDRMRGTKGPNETCGASEECASGICVDTCVGNCGNDGQCPSGLDCSLLAYDRRDITDYVQLACQPSGDGANGAVCFGDDECRSGFCDSNAYLVGGGCLSACATSDDCPGNFVYDYYCGYIPTEAAGGRVDNVQMCIYRNHNGMGRTGAACSADGDCLDRRCVAGACADTCCNDDSCTGSTICRPVLGGSRWEMHCRPGG